MRAPIVITFVDNENFLLGSGIELYRFSVNASPDNQVMFRLLKSLPNSTRLVAVDTSGGRIAYGDERAVPGDTSILVMEVCHGKPNTFVLRPEGKIGAMQGAMQYLPAA